jgi:hypothetical protein
MRGPELVARLRQAGRTARVLYVTGCDEEGPGGVLGEPVLTKPFRPADLMRALSAL